VFKNTLADRKPIAGTLLSSKDGIVEGGDDGITIANTETLVLEELLSIAAGGDGSVVGTADVVEVVADAVDDDVRVKSLLLVGGDGGLVGLEGELGVGTSAETTSEEDGGVAGSEVDGTVVGGGAIVGSGIVGSLPVVSNNASTSVIITYSSGIISRSIISSSIASRGIVVVGSVASSSTVTGAGVGTGGEASEVHLVTGGVDSEEVGEALSDGELGNGDTGSIEGGLDGLGRVGVLDVRAVYGGVKEREDTTEGLGGGEGGIGANVASVDSEGIEVLLSGNDADGGIEDLLVITELGDDVVGKLELYTC